MSRYVFEIKVAKNRLLCIYESGSVEYQKVAVGSSGVIHLSAMAGHKTFCGRWWWADNDNGDGYCQTCLDILARRETATPQISATGQRGLP